MVHLTDGQKATLSPEAVDFLAKIHHPPFADAISGIISKISPIHTIRDAAHAQAVEAEGKLIKDHDLRVDTVELAGVSVVVITPPRIRQENKILFNIFGGGFILGSPQDNMALMTAAELGVPVYSPSYTRAPEARYPVARDECLAVYRELISEGPPGGRGPIDPANIYAQGGSAGGQLLLSMLIKAHQEGTPLPTAGMHLNTPAADLSESGDSVTSNGHGRDVMPASLLWSLAQRHYPPEGGIDDKDPLYSPIYFKGYNADFPRTVITVGTRDVMLSSGVRLYWVLRNAGIEVELLVFEGMWHGFNWDPVVPEAKHAREAVLAFLEKGKQAT